MRSGTTPWWVYVLVGGFVAAVHAVWWFWAQPPVVDGHLADGDSYARLIRVQHLITTGDWFDISFPGSNAPYGDTLHWTRLFDVLLLALTGPFLAWFPFDEALFLAGVWISPVIHIVLALILTWAVRPLMGVGLGAAAGALTSLQIGLVSFAAAGRADHHLLCILLIAIAVGFAIRAMDHERPDRPLVFAALALSAAIWVGPEALVFIVIFQAVLALRWVVGGEEIWGRANMVFAALLTLATGMFNVFERGSAGFGVVEYDKISFVHEMYGAMTFLVWVILSNINLAGWKERLFAGVIGAIAAAGVMLSLFPGLSGGGFAAIDPRMLPYLQLTNEYQPVKDLPNFLAIFGGAVLALPWLAWRLWQTRATPAFWAWLLIGVSLLLYTGLGLAWGRWSAYAGLFLAIAITGLVGEIDAFAGRRFTGPLRSLILVIGIFAVVAGPAMAGVALVEFKDDKRSKPTCLVKDIAPVLSAPPLGDESRIIVASPNYGPELLYRTPHQILSTLLHRNTAGMLDTVAIFGGSDDANIRNVINKRGVDLLLVCRDGGSNAYLDQGAADALYQQLLAGNEPDWLRKIAPDSAEGAGFSLFEVVR